MKKNPIPRWAMIFSITFPALLQSATHGATIKILIPSQQMAGNVLWGPSGSASDIWPFFAARFDETVYASLDSEGASWGADAYLVCAIAGNGAVFTQKEVDNLTFLVHSGSPGAILFDRAPGWGASNSQIAAITGGKSEAQTPISPIFSPEGEHPLVNGITTPLFTSLAGGISGGQPIFGNVVTVVGAGQSIALIGDMQIIGNNFTSQYPANLAFASNLAGFLTVPEPSTSISCILGLTVLIFRRRRHNSPEMELPDRSLTFSLHWVSP